MSMLRVVVVDDEALARARILRMLRELPDVEVVGEAADGVEAGARIEALAPDAVLLDVHMPELDGLRLAQSRAMPPVVFVSAHAAHAVAAFELAAVDYLLKPVTRERLRLAMDRVRRRVGQVQPEVAEVLEAARQRDLPPRLAARDGSRVLLLELSSITRLSARDKYVVVHLRAEARAGAGELLLDDSLNELETKLAPFGFLRAHRAELVNAAAIVALHVADAKATIELVDGGVAPVSRRALPELRRRLSGACPTG